MSTSYRRTALAIILSQLSAAVAVATGAPRATQSLAAKPPAAAGALAAARGRAVPLPLLRPRSDGVDGYRLAWFIWGRRGKSKHVARQAVGWPVGRTWPRDATLVNHWGKILLAAGEQPPELAAADVLIVPRGEISLALDGALMSTEWDLSAALKGDTPAGPMLLVGRWQDSGLAIGVGLPWVPEISPRTEVVLVLGPQPSDAAGLPASARAYKIGWDARRHRNLLWVGLPAGKKWKWRKVEEADQQLRKGFRGGIGSMGDGGVQFAAAEFLIPLTGPLAPAGGSKELTGAAFVLHLPLKAEARDAVFWPPAHSVGYARTESLLLEHPDGWGTLVTDENLKTRKNLLLTALSAAPEIDGTLASGEWDGAARQDLAFPGVGEGQVWIGLHAAKLYVAFRYRPARQKIGSPALELFIDAKGDGGLLPRADDRLVAFTSDRHAPDVLSWHMPSESSGEKIVTAEGDWNRRESRAGEWAWRTSDGVVVAEAAVPLSAVGLDAAKLPPRIGFLARLCYEAAFQMPK